MAKRGLKRKPNHLDWNYFIPTALKAKLDEASESVKQHHPVAGQRRVKNTAKGKPWCDASSLAVGVCIDIDNHIVEDSRFLRSIGDGAHINVAELEAVVKVINLALKRQLKNVTVCADSATVFGWVNSVLKDDKRPKVSGLSEMIVERHLSLNL